MKKFISILLAAIPFVSVAKASDSVKKEVESVYGTHVQIDDAPIKDCKKGTQDWF